ncbi:DUF1206 domain-containing protein [Streptomyces longispororuber]|uniref:DUF1206 domain-containing protein n=1 Tax=Streptomyces longispororuber TaxID=68230 RepID=UPI0021098074|nr:DUF1206 domain-containing protein [Streptomyces longispororuber]MCQ4210860.1 DUF1206 domain-containing protein [Streptomyces longispororuber]
MGIDATARRVADGRAARGATRAGFVARGIVYLLIGALALRISFAGDERRQADRGGALAEVAHQPFGTLLLAALGLALGALALWCLSRAAFRHDEVRERLLWAGRFVFYGVVSYSVLAYAAGDRGSGSGASDQQSDDLTATVLGWPAGQWIVAAVGLGTVGAAGWIAVQAIRRAYRKDLRTSEMSPVAERCVDVLGTVGGTARGCVFAAVGVFLVVAAVRHSPGDAKGMDDTLRSFSHTPAGPGLLAAVAMGLAVFGMFSWAEARWRRL